jgi:hypothetical protein
MGTSPEEDPLLAQLSSASSFDDLDNAGINQLANQLYDIYELPADQRRGLIQSIRERLGGWLARADDTTSTLGRHAVIEVLEIAYFAEVNLNLDEENK